VEGTNEVLSKRDYESMLEGDDEVKDGPIEDDNKDAAGEKDTTDKAKDKERTDEAGAVIGLLKKKRKIAKVGDTEADDGEDIGVKETGNKPVKTTKGKTMRKVKLSFNDDT
jgi:hypothetical protein